MENKVKVSVVMIVKNEELNIRESLNTVKSWADEIVIIDDETTDNTCQIAQEYTDKIFTRKMELEGKQRNWGVSKTRNNWVMFLDADERMTLKLQNEIDEVLSKNDGKAVAYGFHVKII